MKLTKNTFTPTRRILKTPMMTPTETMNKIKVITVLTKIIATKKRPKNKMRRQLMATRMSLNPEVKTQNRMSMLGLWNIVIMIMRKIL